MIKKPIIKREHIIYFVSVLLIISALLWVKFRPIYNPVPGYIKTQADFKVIFPAKYYVNNSSWKYDNKQKSLSFNVLQGNNVITFTEEETPLQFQDDLASYDRFIGSLKPTATFNSPLGSVSLVNFVTQSSYDIVGETGLLNSHNTFLFVHPNNEFTDNDWKSIFNSLKVSN